MAVFVFRDCLNDEVRIANRDFDNQMALADAFVDRTAACKIQHVKRDNKDFVAQTVREAAQAASVADWKSFLC